MRYSQFAPEEQLGPLLQRVINATPFYRMKYRGLSLEPFSMEAFESLPFTSLEEISQRSNLDDLYLDLAESNYVIIREGAAGINNASFWNSSYLDEQTAILATTLEQLGISREDRVLNLFIPGISGMWQLFNLALEKIGPAIIPLGGEAEIPVIARFFDDLRPNALVGKPSALVPVLEHLARGKQEFTIETVIYSGENPSPNQYDTMKRYAQNLFFPIYYTTETGIIGTQCPQRPAGIFHLSNTVYPELIDPQNGKITDKNHGELVITSLTDRASPSLRYRPGSTISLLEEPCNCGNKALLFKLDDW
ncbi:MAG: phenylacetate--CoA ligase family protein [Candidatus Thorarchaeota archaeon]